MNWKATTPLIVVTLGLMGCGDANSNDNTSTTTTTPPRSTARPVDTTGTPRANTDTRNNTYVAPGNSGVGTTGSMSTSGTMNNSSGMGNSSNMGTATTQPDNSGVNTRDRHADAPTAGMAGQSKPDVQLAADIRKRVVDTELSTNAKNSKIVVQNGRVTLRGPVKSQEEKDAIGRIASEIAGAGNVDNLLEIETNNP